MVLALIVPFGGDARAAAPASRPQRGGAVSWRKLSLINGWKSSQPIYRTGDPAYAVKGGVVYLSGSLHGGTSEIFAVLPEAARPSHWLYLTVYTLAGTTGTLRIGPNGELRAYSTPAANATGYTSLAGVSFPASTIRQRKLTLIDGWQSSQGTYGTGDPAYSVTGGVVYLSGSLHGGTNTFAILPPAARPRDTIYRAVYTFDSARGDVDIQPTGQADAPGSSAAQFTSLAGISYPAAATARHTLTLLHGWQSTPGTGSAAYAVSGGVVYLSGSLNQPTGTNDQFALLPKAARPIHALYITVVAGGLNPGTLQIDPNGKIYAYCVSVPVATREAISLSAVSYPRNS